MEVNAWVEKISIPTYKIGAPEKNPMFLEKRVYQGSSGVVYPHPVIEQIADEKTSQEYTGVFLENEYLKILILPELGGRVQRAYDKVRKRDFVYYNQVIKPALVGLAGPWISGGIEFNWPQHHRPSTYSPVDFTIEENADGSKTVWVNEIELMFRTKGMAGFTLYPDKAYLEIKGKLFNRTPFPQTFLWWANPAVKVNDYYQSVFPPDVYAVFDHGKRDVSDFPIATGTYYKVNYAPGTDISRYANIPVPTSYMAIRSKYDFMGCYENDTRAGMLHVANHHVSPGKKQWTWGNSDFGQAWDRNLTDEDGPYIELMTGVFTDNQPDFSWLQPNEEKTFEQYFMPYTQLGLVKNATKEAMLNLEWEGEKLIIKVYTTSIYKDARVSVFKKGALIKEYAAMISPYEVFDQSLTPGEKGTPEDWKVVVTDSEGNILVAYQPDAELKKETPSPATAAKLPAEIEQIEDLYLNGLHLEQYRHATFNPVDYYDEALRRSPGDIRCNNAMGLLLLRRGQFEKAEPYFRKAIQTLTQRNPNPYDGEPYYNLGWSLKLQDKMDEAYEAFYKATWNDAWQHSGFLALARIASTKKNWKDALALVEKSLVRNYHSPTARQLKAALLRKTCSTLAGSASCNAGSTHANTDSAHTNAGTRLAFIQETLKIDPFNFGSLFESWLLYKEGKDASSATAALATMKLLMRDSVQNYLELSLDYAQVGMYEDAGIVLDIFSEGKQQLPTLIPYYKGWLALKDNRTSDALALYKDAARQSPDLCFPNKIEEVLILQSALLLNPADARAHYYLGNFWYDKRQYPEAIACWKQSARLDDRFPTVFRNLSLAAYNKLGEKEQSMKYMETAFALDPSDSRVLMELDQLYKISGRSFAERLDLLEKYPLLVAERDDLYLERVTLYNNLQQYETAKALLAARKFHPWEGGEGKVVGQYLLCHIELAKQALSQRDFQQAFDLLSVTQSYPVNLGEGKLYGAPENDINYLLGCVYEGWGQPGKAMEKFREATTGNSTPVQAIYYNDPQPDKIIYQALAWWKLGEPGRARNIFEKFIEFGRQHMNDRITIDYFAVSLPDMLVFDQDINGRNKTHCNYLIGLGHLGLGDYAAAEKKLMEVIQSDVNHQGAAIYLQMFPFFKEAFNSSTYSCTLYDNRKGKDIYWITLRNGDTEIRITNLGCIITSILTPDREGVRKNIVAGFEEPGDYEQNPYYFGCVVGRTINRIGGGKFSLDGGTVQLSQNEGSNHLHGGFEGFDKKIWDITEVIDREGQVGVVFSYTSRDGEEGYPGNLQAQVKYVLGPENKLLMEYRAVSDKKTPVNLSNHSYFNLTGFDNPLITDHLLTIHAEKYTEKNGNNLPTGNILPLSGTPLDFSSPKRIGDHIDQFPLDRGFDHNFVLETALPGTLTPAAELYDPSTGRGLRITTDRPGIQLYTANWWNGALHTPDGRPYRQHGAVALETQAFPDSPNHSGFPDTILAPGDTYQGATVFGFFVK